MKFLGHNISQVIIKLQPILLKVWVTDYVQSTNPQNLLNCSFPRLTPDILT